MAKNLPTTIGYYWAKTDDYQYFNAIIKVIGESPFFKIEGWDFRGDKTVTSISKVSEFGDKINEMK